MDDLAREAGVHPVHLSRVFRRITGKGIGEYVHRLRIREACERMIKPEASLADISCDLGFADQSHFTRTFHTITGTSPGVFRAQILRQLERFHRQHRPSAGGARRQACISTPGNPAALAAEVIVRELVSTLKQH